MEWYYAEGGQQKGPVSAEEFASLLQAGTVRADTLVWRDGMSNWQPYGQVATAAPAGPGGGVICSECGGAFPPDEVTRDGEVWVCGACKPQLLQPFRERGPGLADGQGGVSADELVARDYTVDIGDYLNRAWDLFRNNVGVVLGATVLVYLVMIALNIIPYLGGLLSLIFTGPLMGGLWWFYVRLASGEQVSVGEAFGGFGPRFLQLLLANVVTGVLSGLCVLPALLLGAGAAVGSQVSRQGGGGAAGDLLTGGMMVLFIILMVLGFAGYLYLMICWFFTLPLVADKGMAFWPAMSLSRRVVLKHWWWTLLLSIVAGVLVMGGVLLCGVGLLVTGPLAMGMVTLHYCKVFGDLRPGAE